jgi:hypothetical protein
MPRRKKIKEAPAITAHEPQYVLSHNTFHAGEQWNSDTAQSIAAAITVNATALLKLCEALGAQQLHIGPK